MPTGFLSEEQRRHFGHFTEDPDEGQFAGSSLLDQTARRRAMAARGARHRIGRAIQPGAVRYLGTSLARRLHRRAWTGATKRLARRWCCPG
ncbi:DUF4158 domain-containing protein [Streptomyces sp. NPDC086777]|uniref:DUF4158 domain-containing protein n=1 Tax=Streptomyces sp. NPDC086777 TaxID=3154866 RepID=UPI00344C6221